MKAFLLWLPATLFYYLSNAQCTTNPVAFGDMYFQQINGPSGPVIDSSIGVYVQSFPPNSIVNLYTGSNIQFGSIITGSNGAGFINLTPSTCPNCPWDFSFNSIVASTGICSARTSLAGILPIKLSSFSAINISGKITCNWETANELPFTVYELQTSDDGVNYTASQSIKTNIETTTSHQYQYTFSTTSFTKTYCRLKVVEADGRYFYSPIRIIYNKNIAEPKVSYSSTTKTLLVNLPTEFVKGNMVVYNSNGNVVYNNTIVNSTIPINFIWSKGIYYLRAITVSGNKIVKPVVIQ